MMMCHASGCMGHVETVMGVDGLITYVNREVEEREEEYNEKRRESVWEEKEMRWQEMELPTLGLLGIGGHVCRGLGPPRMCS